MEHTTTYTTEQIVAIGGNEWTGRDGRIHRVYLNDAHEYLGITVDRYKGGRIGAATLDGAPISNGKATRILHHLGVYVEDGQVVITGADRVRVELRDPHFDVEGRIHAAIAAQVEAL